MLAAGTCDRCGYDLRVQPGDGVCPECGMSVAESRRLSAEPRRPAWGEADPRWRRRMLAGVWILLLMPLAEVLKAVGWASRIPVPGLFPIGGRVRTLDDTLLYATGAFAPLLFCTGMVLLFSKERGRRASRRDWTRRWGVACSYVALLLNAAPILFISALVLVGISAVFISMPLQYQPGITSMFAKFSTAYLRYGPQPRPVASAVTVAFASVVILLACVPLLDALRSSGPRWLALLLLAPLALFSAVHLEQAAAFCVGPLTVSDLFQYSAYFRPELLVRAAASFPSRVDLTNAGFDMEIVKWSIVLAIAIWLSAAQIAAWRRREGERAPAEANAGQKE